MTTRSRLLTATATVALGGAALLGTSATARTQSPAKLTAKGTGDVRIGALHTDLRAAGLVGKRQSGCELEGPDVKAARLRAPLKGFVDYGASSPSRVRSITIRGGAEARGIGVGDTLAAVQEAFPKAKVLDIPEFSIKRVRVPKGGGGRMDFIVGGSSGEVREIDVPRLRICD